MNINFNRARSNLALAYSSVCLAIESAESGINKHNELCKLEFNYHESQMLLMAMQSLRDSVAGVVCITVDGTTYDEVLPLVPYTEQ